MKKYYPAYYNEFTCIADKCPDNCCKKWEIDIDEKTKTLYSQLNNSLGEEIRSFYKTTDDGETCFSLVNDNCPFLNEKGLCRIHLSLGEDYTSEICRMHPRFVEEYDSYTEISLSLSCPVAAEIILNSQYTEKTYPSFRYVGDDEVLELLLKTRTEIHSMSNIGFAKLISELLSYAVSDYLYIADEDVKSLPTIDVMFLKRFALFCLDNCEILTSEWKNLLKKSISSTVSDVELEVYIKQNEAVLQNCFHYYLFRYYTKAVNDLDTVSRALFIAVSCYFGAYCSFVNCISLIETLRIYSKETEHSLYNIDTLNEYFATFWR